MDAETLETRVALAISATTIDWGDEEPEVWETHRILARAALREIVAAAECLDDRDVDYTASGIEGHADSFGVTWPSQQRRLRAVAALLRALAERGKDA